MDSAALVAARDSLAPIFTGRPEDSDVHVSVSGDGGRWWFIDHRVLWRTQDPARLPPSASAAELVARSFMGRVGQAVEADRDLASAGIHRLFPDDLRPALISLAIDPDRGVVDHWLVRFDTYLPTGTSAESVQVYGAVVDVRVCSDGAIGGFWLAWRPCFPQGRTPLYELTNAASTPQNSKDQSFADQTSEGRTPPMLVYLLADEGVSQTFVSPYYFSAQDDDGDFLPASLYSPVVKIVDDPQSEFLRVMAAVTGGSSQYAYRWAAWDLTQPSIGILDWGSDDAVSLDAGTYNVMLGVTDVVTGVVVVVERSVYTNMFMSTALSS